MSQQKPQIALFANKLLPLNDYRILSARNLADRAEFHFILPKWYPTARDIPFTFHYVSIAEGLKPKNDALGLLELLTLFFVHRFDAVHFFSSKYYLVGPIIAKMFCAKKIYITITGLGRAFSSDKMVYRCIQPLFLTLLAISTKVCHCILTQNRDDAVYLKSVFPWIADKVEVLPSAVDEEDMLRSCEGHEIPPDLKPTQGVVQLLKVARIMEDKGVNEYLDLCQSLKLKFGDKVRFFLVGPSSVGQDTLLQQVEKAVENGTVTYLGERYDVPLLMSAVDMFVFCSTYREGIPRVLMEAQIMGLPCIGFDVPGVRDVIIDGKTGYLVSKGDLKAMERCIVDLIEDKAKREAMAKEARKRAHEEYALKRYQETVSSLYGIS